MRGEMAKSTAWPESGKIRGGSAWARMRGRKDTRSRAPAPTTSNMSRRVRIPAIAAFNSKKSFED
jgi:hypothetical protein